MADRIMIVSGDREQLASAEGERLSYRASLLINLAASVALYGLGYLVLRGIIHLIAG